MGYIKISGDDEYVRKMSMHLMHEHPETKRMMQISLDHSHPERYRFKSNLR